MLKIQPKSYTHHEQIATRGDLLITMNSATARPLHISEHANIRWLITHSQEHVQLGRIFQLYVEGSYLNSLGSIFTPFLVTQINEFWGRYTSITIGTFDWITQSMIYEPYLILTELVDIPTELQLHATNAILTNPDYTFHMHTE